MKKLLKNKWAVRFRDFLFAVLVLGIGIHLVWGAEVGTIGTPTLTVYGNNSQTAILEWSVSGSAGGGTNTGGAALSTTNLTFLREGGYHIDHVDIIAGATASTTNTDVRFNTTTTDNTTDLLGGEGVDELDASGTARIIPAIDGVPSYVPLIDQFYIETVGNSNTGNTFTVKMTAIKR